MGLSSLDLRVSHTICRVSIAESLRTQLPHPIFCRLCPHTWIQQAGCLISESHDCLPLNLSSKSSPKPSGLCPPTLPRRVVFSAIAVEGFLRLRYPSVHPLHTSD